MKVFSFATMAAFIAFAGPVFAGPVTITEADRAAIQSRDLAMPAGVPMIDKDGNFYGYTTPELAEKVKQAVDMGISEIKAIRQITGLKKNVPHQRRTEYTAQESEALQKAVEVRDGNGKIWGMTTPEIAKEIEDAVTIGIERPTAIKRFTKWRQPVLGHSPIPVSAEVFAGIEPVPVEVPTTDQAETAEISTPPAIEAEAEKPAEAIPASIPDIDL